MKHILLLIGVLFFFTNSKAQCTGEVTIPDVNVKNKLVAHGKSIGGIGVSIIDTNNDGKIQCSEASAYTGTITLINKNVSDLTGLEQFTNITRLYVGFNNLYSLNITSNKKLTLLNASNNSLSSLDVSQNTLLESLSVEDNNLNSLDLTTLTNLKTLTVSRNSLSTLNLSNNIALETLRIENNDINTLNISNNINLKDFNAGYNFLSSLDITNNLLLETFAIRNNILTNLDLSKNINLTTVNLRNNKIVNLDASKNNNLIQFICDNNPELTSLNVANGNNTALTSMWANNTPKLSCIQHDTGFTPPVSFGGWIKDATANWSTNCNATASIKDINKIEFEIFPNPTKRIFNIETNENLKKGIIYSTTGKKIKEFKTKTIDISSFEKGIYLLKIENLNGEIGIQKIIKD